MTTPEDAVSRIYGHFPNCPSRTHFPVITGFVTPGSDFPPPHPLDASVTMDVFDPTEFIAPGRPERIRVVEVDDPFLIEVNWCVCGEFAAGLAGCWELNFYLNTIDGGGKKSSGLIGSETRDVDDEVKSASKSDDDFARRCYTRSLTVGANKIEEGAYSLLVIITLRRGKCSDPKPGRRLGDYLGFAEIPVLVFVPGE